MKAPDPKDRPRRRGQAAPRRPRAATAPIGEPIELTGSVESVVYRSEDTGYTVFRIDSGDGREPATAVGTVAAIWVGETVRAAGAWVHHPQHGPQFQATSVVCVTPTSVEGLERYLASGMIRGIGKVNASRLVRKFGEQTLEIIEKYSKRLEEVEGIGPKRRQMIKDSWIEQKGIRDIMIFLQGNGIGTGQAARIFRHYGAQAVAVIRENPYRLCGEVWGIGFKTADGLAQRLGIAPDSEVRARAGLGYVLESLTDEGHCYCPQAELLLMAQDLLGISVERLAEALECEVRDNRLVREEDRIYLRPIYNAEVAVARRIECILSTPPAFRPIAADKALPWAEKQMRLTFAPQQAAALRMALTGKCAIMTGGPGVGKTTIIRALVDVFEARHLRVLLAAPTGRAAKRMEEATQHAAGTVHRLLKFQPRTGEFEHDASTPLEADVVILDEVSMMDIRLMGHFLAAVPDAACVVLVGDIDQLPSVGPGNVLRDLIHSQRVPCTRLETIFRQEKGGWIVRNAHRINEGQALELPDSGGELSDFYFIHTEEPDAVIERTIDLITRRIPQRFGLDPLTDIQILTPMRRNQLGADNLNVVLQAALNPTGPAVERFGRRYRVKDRVMQIRNNYDKDVFNGDVGRIARVEAEDQQVAVDFEGRTVFYDFSELDELMHAYACTIHKSQGSEYPAVVILMTTQHYKLLQRNLLYTAITRARRLVCLVGTRMAVQMAIRNNQIRQRRTGLRERLERALPGPYGTAATAS